jgi:hypothetical protein
MGTHTKSGLGPFPFKKIRTKDLVYGEGDEEERQERSLDERDAAHQAHRQQHDVADQDPASQRQLLMGGEGSASLCAADILKIPQVPYLLFKEGRKGKKSGMRQLQ